MPTRNSIRSGRAAWTRGRSTSIERGNALANTLFGEVSNAGTAPEDGSLATRAEAVWVGGLEPFGEDPVVLGELVNPLF